MWYGALGCCWSLQDFDFLGLKVMYFRAYINYYYFEGTHNLGTLCSKRGLLKVGLKSNKMVKMYMAVSLFCLTSVTFFLTDATLFFSFWILRWLRYFQPSQRAFKLQRHFDKCNITKRPKNNSIFLSCFKTTCFLQKKKK